jgi:hypothetical protein
MLAQATGRAAGIHLGWREAMAVAIDSSGRAWCMEGVEEQSKFGQLEA